MTVFDPTQYPELRNLFPELTPVQFETSFLFAFGIPQKEISLLRDVNYRLVKREIAEAKSKFETKSLTGLLTIFHVRLVLFALYGCRKKSIDE
ncbi:transcriptional regulator [Arsenophonus nasoniae]|uniref:Transcriptional regulator n=1 Tax=Arsenophonus nasoniae TaxID=638 RepID=A0AA95GWN3_9GAMM|nr:transcriptional regulator [Arsenophonus nasoniae]WGM04109.1 transcriptional regulator [Arsenophonus nasoniae]